MAGEVSDKSAIDSTVPEGMMLNKPSVLGRECGEHLARLTDEAEKRLIGHRQRCKTCAFRRGTYPNGCEATLDAAIQCVLSGEPFYCHEKPASEEAETVCAGWLIAMSGPRA